MMENAHDPMDGCCFQAQLTTQWRLNPMLGAYVLSESRVGPEKSPSFGAGGRKHFGAARECQALTHGEAFSRASQARPGIHDGSSCLWDSES